MATRSEILLHGYEAVDAIGGLDDVTRETLLIRIGSEKAKAGDADAARVYLEQARQLARALGSVESLAEAALAQTRYVWSLEAETAERQLLSEPLASGGLNPVDAGPTARRAGEVGRGQYGSVRREAARSCGRHGSCARDR